MSALGARASLHPVRVYYEDTDAGGVVYHTNYLKFAERARTEMLREVGIEQEALRTGSGAALVVRRMTVDFLAPARLDDELVVASRVIGLAGASLEIEQEIRRGAEALVRLTSQIACLGPSGRPTRLPPALRAALASLDEPSRMVSAHGR
jgi:acyl-CoA thioester hydrolase